MSEDEQFYTLVFKGDVRSMSGNLFKLVTPFGEVVSIGVGDAFSELDELRENAEKSEGAHA